MRSYEELKKEIINITKIVDTLPEGIKEKAFEVLVNAFIHTGENSNDQNYSKFHISLENIAEITSEGSFKFILRDPKAKSAKDAAKRIIYMLIRSYTLLTKEKGVSRKNVVNPILNDWKLNTGNTRGFITNDMGIVKTGDILSLDKVAEKEADKYILQINDPSYVGLWNPR